jgi:two-component system cell cycle response regulator DivK
MAKILIVDDMEANRELVARFLQIGGHECIYAENGVEAIEATTNNKPDLILMDMGLPVMDGWEATEKIRSKNIKIPIIALTAHSMATERDKAIEAGCDEFETKPIDYPSLMSKVNRLLSSSQ